MIGKRFSFQMFHHLDTPALIEMFCNPVSDVHEELLRAVIENDGDTVSDFLERPHCDLNPPTSHGWSPFHISIMLKRIDICKKFVRSNELHGHVFELRGLFGETPLHVAAAMGIDLNIFFQNSFEFQGNRPDSNAKDSRQYTPIDYAIYHGNAKGVRCLLDNGSNLNFCRRDFHELTEF